MWYTSITEDKYGFGTNGLTDITKLGIAQMLRGKVQNRGLLDYIGNLDSATIKGMSGVFNSLAQYLHLAAAIETGTEGKHSIEDLFTEDLDPQAYKDIDAALQNVGSSASVAKQAVKDINDEMSSAGVSAAGAYGDATKEVVSLMEQLSGTAKEAADAILGVVAALDEYKKYSDLKTAMDAEGGTSNPYVVKGIASAINKDEDWVVQNWDQARTLFNMQYAGKEETASTNIHGLIEQYATDDLFRALGFDSVPSM